MPRPTVLLDIDGVLLPFDCDGHKAVAPDQGALFPDSCLEALSTLMEETGARLVLSSTWRASEAAMSAAIDDFARYAGEHGGPLGAVRSFASTTDTTRFSIRQHELWLWLEQQRASASDAGVGPWVALDDEALIEGPEAAPHRDEFVGHVVQTESHIGLTRGQALEAVKLLQHQQQSAMHARASRRGKRQPVRQPNRHQRPRASQ